MQAIEAEAGVASRRALFVVLGLTLGFLVIEIIAGVMTHSLALVADAVHMGTDAAALALAAFASWMASRNAPSAKTYGYYRVEILAALVNGVLLLGSALYILYESYQRFQSPGEIGGVPMLIVAVIGLGVNAIGIRMLHGHAEENLNVQGALYEVVKDALGSVGVIIAGVVIITAGWTLIDPIVSALIALLILPRTWGLLSEAVDILLEAAPGHIEIADVESAMREVEGVDLVHEVHVWTITSGFVAMSGHAVVEDGTDRQAAQRILEEMRDRLRDRFGIEHTTIQIEYEDLQAET